MATDPPICPVPADWKTKIMHSRITIDGEVLIAVPDATPGDYHQPQGFSVALAIENPAEAERRFNALAKAARANAVRQDLFSNGFGMCVDKFGIPWMVNCPKEDVSSPILMVRSRVSGVEPCGPAGAIHPSRRAKTRSSG